MTDQHPAPDEDAWRYVPPRRAHSVTEPDVSSRYAAEGPGEAPAVPVASERPENRDLAPWGPPPQGSSQFSSPTSHQAPQPPPQGAQPQFPPATSHQTPQPLVPGAPPQYVLVPGPQGWQPAPVPTPKVPAWAFEEPQPLPYHRMARIDWRVAQWWRPFATAGLVIALTLAGFVFWGLFMLAWGLLGLPEPTDDLDDGSNPADLILMLGSLAMFVPVVMLASWWGGGRRGSIHSVFGRFRWGLLGRAARVIVPVYALAILVPALVFGREDMTVPPLSASLVAAYVIILVVTPLQCAGEEYLFRGFPQQALGTWLKSPLWGIVLPVPLFVLGHGYDWVGLIDVACFGLCAGALVWRSGGLELAILVHAANNTMSFLLAPLTPNSLEQGAVDPAALLFSLPLIFAVTAGLWWWVGRRYGVDWKTPVRRFPGPQQEPVGRWL